MDVVVGDMNGGNAAVARDDSNLEKKICEEQAKAEEETATDSIIQVRAKMDEDDINGDDKSSVKKSESVVKRRMRKSKSNSTGSVENDAKPKAKGLKRKLSEPDVVVNSDEAEVFIGFSIDSVSIGENGLQVLQKLIAEAELEETNTIKRRRIPTKPAQKPPPELKGAVEENSTIDDNKNFQLASEEVKSKAKDEKEVEKANESVTNETNNFDSEVNMTNPLFREPFKHGWKREMIYKGGLDSSPRKTADIFYWSPKGKKVKNLKEVVECLTSKELTIDNFTFHKEPIGVDDPALEIIRDAKRLRSEAVAPAATSLKKTLNKRVSVSKKAPTPPPASPKTTGKISPPKVITPAAFKVKVPAKRGSHKKEIKSTKEEMLPPQWSPPTITRRSQTVVDKITSPKNKRILKIKPQEPCSIRCSLSMGLIPSLQCRLCLCLYHPECVGSKSSYNEEYICKNCHAELDPSNQQQHQQTSPAPPPLIPISMIGSHSVKSKIGATSSKPRGTKSTTKLIASKSILSSTKSTDEPLREKTTTKSTTTEVSPINKIDSFWRAPPGREFMHSHDGSIPKPAQNIAVMGGKRYIVVPKNNDMAVQPAIPIRADKNYEKQFMRDNSITNISSQISGDIVETSHATKQKVSTEEKENKGQHRKRSIEKEVEESCLKKHEKIPAAETKTAEMKSQIVVQTMEVPMDAEPIEIDHNAETTLAESLTRVDEQLVKRKKSRTKEQKVLEEANSFEEVMVSKVYEEMNVCEKNDVPKELTIVKKKTLPIVKTQKTTDELKIMNAPKAIEKSKVIEKPKVIYDAKVHEKSKVPKAVILKESNVADKAAEESPISEEKKFPEGLMDVKEDNNVPETSIKLVSDDVMQNKEKLGVEKTVVPAIVEKKKANSTKRRLLLPIEADPKQHFMVSVCAGYHALSRIFQYLKVQELLRAARVCRMWRDLAAHPALWKTVRMKNSQVTDWDGLAASLKRHSTQHLDLRKMLIAGESDNIWEKFVAVLPSVPNLIKLELCRCPASVVEEIFKCCPQLEVLSAMAIKCDSVDVEALGNLKYLTELKLKAISGMSIANDLTPLEQLTKMTQLSLTSVKDLGKKKIEVLGSLTRLESLELGECSDFPDKFGTNVLLRLTNLERLRLEKGQGTCCTFDILEGISKLEKLVQLELVNFDVKNGFDKYLANCKNIKRLLIIPTYISQSATSNNMVLGGVTALSENLSHFVWGVTLELLRVTELFVDQCNQMNKQVSGDSIPVLKPVPCLKLIEQVDEEKEELKADDKQSSLSNPQVDILPLPQLQKLLLTALPKTRVKILKIPFHATWRQNISDTTSQ